MKSLLSNRLMCILLLLFGFYSLYYFRFMYALMITHTNIDSTNDYYPKDIPNSLLFAFTLFLWTFFSLSLEIRWMYRFPSRFSSLMRTTKFKVKKITPAQWLLNNFHTSIHKMMFNCPIKKYSKLCSYADCSEQRAIQSVIVIVFVRSSMRMDITARSAGWFVCQTIGKLWYKLNEKMIRNTESLAISCCLFRVTVERMPNYILWEVSVSMCLRVLVCFVSYQIGRFLVQSILGNSIKSFLAFSCLCRRFRFILQLGKLLSLWTLIYKASTVSLSLIDGTFLFGQTKNK